MINILYISLVLITLLGLLYCIKNNRVQKRLIQKEIESIKDLRKEMAEK